MSTPEEKISELLYTDEFWERTTKKMARDIDAAGSGKETEMKKLSKVEAYEAALNGAVGMLRQGKAVHIFDWKKGNTYQLCVADELDSEENPEVFPFEYETIDESLFRSSAHVLAVFVSAPKNKIECHQAVKDSAKVINDAEHDRAMNFKILKGG